ncbi:MAG: metalloregulator ArsR/SmtB family transcription factor [Planctomycetota bacterium]|jgi:SAM-dependent methyltransferase|nr:metalloregulator ArsR/SmtB family transcription factor [Planctomycetota bacterium]
MIDLASTSHLARLYGDGSRLRLLALLAREELTVAELTSTTRLGQSRVSTHLGKLREAGLLRVRRNGTSTYYALDEAGMSAAARRLWDAFRVSLDDQLLDEDVERLEGVVAARSGKWADSVAGQMERHYSPGRTWEGAARALVGLAALGDVLDVASGDGALAELVAPRARSVTCLDVSARVVSAGRKRLGHVSSVRFATGDMHRLPFCEGRFDQIMLVNSLSYAEQPRAVVSEASRVLRPGGGLVAVTLAPHKHEQVARSFNHAQMGFDPDALRALFAEEGFRVDLCAVTSREKRAPHLAVVSVYATRMNGEGRTPKTKDLV